MTLKRFLCGPENSGRDKFEATQDVGGGSESEKDEKEMKRILKPRVGWIQGSKAGWDQG